MTRNARLKVCVLMDGGKLAKGRQTLTQIQLAVA